MVRELSREPAMFQIGLWGKVLTFDVMHMQPLRKIIRPELSDVMITEVVCNRGEARDANPTEYET